MQSNCQVGTGPACLITVRLAGINLYHLSSVQSLGSCEQSDFLTVMQTGKLVRGLEKPDFPRCISPGDLQFLCNRGSNPLFMREARAGLRLQTPVSLQTFRIEEQLHKRCYSYSKEAVLPVCFCIRDSLHCEKQCCLSVPCMAALRYFSRTVKTVET